MRVLSALWFSIRAAIRRSRADAELDEELAFHLEREAAIRERAGLSPEAARREATRHFGGVQRYREECRDVRRTAWLDDATADVRFALRLVRLHPGFSASVIAISGLGIAACVTTFSIVSGILLSPLPFGQPSRIFGMQLTSVDGRSSAAVPVAEYLRITAGSPVFEAVASAIPDGAAVMWKGEPERVRTALVTPSMFRVFGVQPVLGRAFTPSETEAHERVALLGYEAWRARFRADSNVLGAQITIAEQSYTIIGVMPPRFRAYFNFDPALWLPNRITAAGDPEGRTSVNPVLRLADGVTRDAAEAWLRAVMRVKMPSLTYADSVAAAPEIYSIADRIYGEVKRPLLVLLGAVLLVLLLVAANVATMFLARSSARGRELAVRRALGATGNRQLRQLVTESLTLTAIGGGLGMLVSIWAIGGVRVLGARVLPRLDDVAVDWRVAAFAVAGTMLTGIVGGLAPALSASRATAPAGQEHAASRVTGHRASTGLVITQIALAVVLLVGAGLLVKGFLRVMPTDPGFTLDHRAAMSIALRGRPAIADTAPEGARRFADNVVANIGRLRGVSDVAVTSFLPFSGSASLVDVYLSDLPASQRPPTAFQNLISPNFFMVMGMRIRRGRAFDARDVTGAEPVAIINETAASRWWPGENPLGRQVAGRGRERFTATVVGVVSDARNTGTDTKVRAEIYFPIGQGSPRFLSFVVYTTVDPHTLADDMRRAVWKVAPTLPVGTVTDLETMASDSLKNARFFSVAMGLFAAVAVALSGLAVHGLLAFAVTERRREIGIRVALGASPAHVGALVVRRAATLGACGVIIGVGLARLLTRYMESLLLEVTATDATVFLTTGVAVLALSVLASCAAVQALRVDPVNSLRA